MNYNIKRHKWVIGGFRKPLNLKRQLGMITQDMLFNKKVKNAWRNKKHKDLWFKASIRGIIDKTKLDNITRR